MNTWSLRKMLGIGLGFVSRIPTVRLLTRESCFSK
jgi:hypothetical protein